MSLDFEGKYRESSGYSDIWLMTPAVIGTPVMLSFRVKARVVPSFIT